ncbi:1-phosphatidylinositol phosphodiesterase [Puia dinghuensis]|uniref:1-phosphatidylinositol phosphodiesterase n=2 Tax=Puia dinghuensis TaxID=1792502 RepID=A0A8J2XTD7_9BACT|nr:1-phosphatidylinositol phosphodiesterase [Puia dinghuensis]
MASISDNINLANLSIPGSHDACARYEPIAGTAICQSLSLGDQLNAGSRFLDIRCRNVNDSFAIHHGSIYQHLNFTDVLNACKTFFAAHPNETIIMSVKEEYTASGNTLSFEQVFLQHYYASNSNLFYMGTSVPNLGAVRGKIVLLRRFNAYDSATGAADGNLYGIDATNWGDNTTFTTSTGTATLHVEDDYVVNNNNTKWSEITANLSNALSGDPTALYISFTSGYYPILGFIPNIPDVSNTINPDINSYFGAATHGRYGIIPMDFVDATRPAAIIGTDY